MRISDWSSDVCSSDLSLIAGRSALGPGLAHLARFLEDGDPVGLLQGEADVVEAVHQAVLAEGIDVEGDGAAVRPGDLLLLQIDGDDGVGAARDRKSTRLNSSH